MNKILITAFLSILCLTSCTKKAADTQEQTIVVKSDFLEERTGDELKIVAIMTVKPECIEDIKPIFQAIVTGSQEEDGCIFYNLHQDINDPTKFVMLEEWDSQEAIDFHNNTEHYKTFKEASKGMIEKSEVSVLKLIY